MAPLVADQLIIDIPVNGTIYPPDIIPPQFAWRDDNSRRMAYRNRLWRSRPSDQSLVKWREDAACPGRCKLVGYVPPTLTEQQAAAHTWRPDAKTWEEIKQHTVEKPATVTVTGYASEKDKQPLSHAQAAISTSKTPSARRSSFAMCR